jgi:hypothetical protein
MDDPTLDSFSTSGESFANPPAPESTTGTRMSLVVAAVLVLAAGVLALLFALILVAVAPGLMEQDPASTLMGGVGLALMGGVALAIGLGLLAAKRWARRLGVLMAASLLAIGLLSLAGALIFTPREAGFAAGLAVALILVVPFVAAPLALWILLSRPALVAHIERKDPLPGWTEQHSLPLLGLVLFLATGTLSLVQATHPPVQMASLLRVSLGLWKFWTLVAGLVSALLAWGMWKKDMRAWWAALAWFPFSALVGWAMLGSAPDLAATADPALLQGLNAARRGAFIWPLAMMAWLLWVRPQLTRKGSDTL